MVRTLTRSPDCPPAAGTGENIDILHCGAVLAGAEAGRHGAEYGAAESERRTPDAQHLW